MSATAVEVDPGTQIRTLREPVAGDANMWAVGLATADVTVTVVAPATGSGKFILIERVDWSYTGGTPVGRLTVGYGSTVVFDIDIITAGPASVEVNRVIPLETAAIVKLFGGGSGLIGKLNVIARMIQ